MSTTPFQLNPEKHQFGLYARKQLQPVQQLERCLNFDPARPTVIVLPGTRVNHEIPAQSMANGMVGQVEKLLGSRKQDVNIACFVYSHNDEQAIANHYARTRPAQHPRDSGSPVPTGGDIHDFVDQVLLPYMGVGQGKHPKPQEICNRLATLTLFAHSFGTAFAQETAACLVDKLKAEGYSGTEAARITAEIVVVGCGNMSRLDHGDPVMRSVIFSATRDDTTWDTAGRIAHDHKNDKLKGTADRHPADIQSKYYTDSGLDPAYILSGSTRQHKQTILQSAETKLSGLGRLIRFTAPPAVHSADGKHTITSQPNLDATAKELNEKLVSFNFPLTGLNGEPLVQNNLCPAHDVPMFTWRGAENAALVDKVGAVLLAATRRPALAFDTDLSRSIAEIAAAKPPSLGASPSAA